MSILAGPDLVQDGLICHLDASNLNSLNTISRNIVSAQSIYNPSSWTMYFTDANITTGIDAPDGSLTAVRFAGRGASTSLLRVAFPSFTPNGTDQYTISFYVRMVGQGTKALPSNQITCDFNDLNDFDYRPFLVSNTWVRVSTTFTPTATARSFFDIMSDRTIDYVLDFWGLQIEVGGSASTYYPPYATTQPVNKWYDLSGNSANGTLLNSFNYNNFSYSAPTLAINNNGSTSNGAVSLSTADLNALALTQNFSVMFAAKKNYYGIAGNNTGNSQLFQGVVNGYNTGWRILENSQGTPGAAFSGRHSFNLGYNDINTTLTVNDNNSTVNRMCIGGFSISSSTILGFLNGTTNSRSNPLTYASGTSNPQISWTGAGAGSWNGLVGFFMIYNRALSLAEMTQNYNALRSRYGI